MNPVVPRPSKRCAYARCGRFFRPKHSYKRAKYCSRECAAAARPRMARVAAGRRGGRARAAKYRPLRARALRQRIDGMTPLEAWRDGRRFGKHQLNNCVQTAKRASFAEGYEAALRDMRLEKTA